MKIIEMLRLSEMGLSQRQIASGAGCARSTVGDVLRLCREKELDFERASQLTDTQLQALLYPPSETTFKRAPEPDWTAVQEELARNKALNLQFLWEEYRVKHPDDGLSYSRYCRHYREFRTATGRSVSLHNERKAGELMEGDWMGDTLPCVIHAGKAVTAHFFVAVLGYSGMPYVEAFPNEQESNWIKAHVDALRFYGGVPRIIEPDNCKTAVKTPRYYEPLVNSAYWELARHYSVAVVPARVRKPKDKPLVEQTVGWLETWLLGKLRNQTFSDFEALNREIRRIMRELCTRPFQKREGSRQSEFDRIDKPALRSLPAQKYEAADIVQRTVSDNYHVEYAGFHYSVPYTLHRERVAVRATNTMIEIFDSNHLRMASHPRRHQNTAGRYITDVAHMPPNHRAVHEARSFDGPRYRSWARRIGENTLFVIEALLHGGAVEEQGYRACMGVLQFAKSHGDSVLESACTQARATGCCTYTHVKNLIKKQTEPLAVPAVRHENIRGGAYYH